MFGDLPQLPSIIHGIGLARHYKDVSEYHVRLTFVFFFSGE
jgi:hypothetical protein